MAINERFAFGSNWLDYVENKIDQKKIESAVQSEKNMLKSETLVGQSFLDVGCGSGLFSLAACLLDAEEVYSFDYDEKSVLATKKLREQFQIPETKWYIAQGDVLDQKWMSSITDADIVYSWGVLHHTGSMWQAIENTACKVKPGGFLAISIYNKVDNPRDSSKMWWKVKRFYNGSPSFIKEIMIALYMMKVMLGHIRRGKDPVKEIKSYGERGMDFFHDARDWVGGFPYEYADSEDVIRFIRKDRPFELIYINQVVGNACNEFTFRLKN
jgi:2-polyprenyl-3-methyl-5-hydroxy-6-metoxy-1,4-benzoquinol methylase